MTEIPEHLLKRSKERRAAMGRGEGDAGESADAPAASSESAATPTAAVEQAPKTVPAPADAAPKPAAPVPAYIQAAQGRRRVPVWAMPVLALLPLWAIFYVSAMQEPPLGENDPIVLGERLYESHCGSCHGAGGAGGVGPAFTNGAVLRTWPDSADHTEWVKVGSSGWPGDTYGAQDRPKGATAMPGFGDQLDDEQIALIVRYERQVFGGEDPAEACKITEEVDPVSCDDI